jgi:hypothetical protein
LGCHSDTDTQGNFIITYDTLLNGQTNCSEYVKYIDPANVDQSLFLVKIDHSLDLRGCGVRMPLGAMPPNSPLVNLVRTWITDGALP